VINIQDLESFAQNEFIELGQCDLNAYRVYSEFGGDICLGTACSYKDGILSEPLGHYRNLLCLRNAEGSVVQSIVDIYNLKKAKIEYRNWELDKTLSKQDHEFLEIEERMSFWNHCQAHLDAVRVASEPVSFGSNKEWKLYRQEWSHQVFSRPNPVTGYFWLENRNIGFFELVETASEIVTLIKRHQKIV
jgi:hypothetical protein